MYCFRIWLVLPTFCLETYSVSENIKIFYCIILKSLKKLTLNLSNLNHPAIDFVFNARWRFNFIFIPNRYLIFQHHLLKILFFLIDLKRHIFHVPDIHICVVYLLVLYSDILGFLSITGKYLF